MSPVATRAPPSGSSPSALSARAPSAARGVATKGPSAMTSSSTPVTARTSGHAGPSSRSANAAAAEERDGGAEQVAQLRERLEQLESELKGSQDTAQWTIRQNKNTLLALKQENKDLSAEVSRRGGSNELQCKQGTATDGEKVIERLERQAHELRRAHDKVIKDKKTALQKLDNLHDNLRDLAKVAASALPPHLTASASSAPFASSAATPLSASTASIASTAVIAAAVAALPANSAAARELRQLQNRLDKATIKANEAFSIRKTYEQVLEKLRLEEPLIEGRIRALQEQRATKKAALQTATISGREVSGGKEAAKATLAALEGDVAAARARRARVLAEMRDKASTVQLTNRALMQRQFEPLTAPASPPGAAANGQQRPHASDPEGAEGAGADGEEDITARDLVVRLCRASGAARVSELLSRLLAQQDSYGGLLRMRAAATAQRMALSQELEVLRSHRDALRGGGKLSTQKQLDAAQEELRDAASRAEAGSEGLEAVLRGTAGVRAGLEHLAAMAAPLPLPMGGPPAVPVEDETLGDVLAQVEQRLAGAYRFIVTLPKAVDMLESMYAAVRGEA